MSTEIFLKFRSCPRCCGTVIVDRDLDSWYKKCLQCGYHRDLPKAEAERVKALGLARLREKCRES